MANETKQGKLLSPQTSCKEISDSCIEFDTVIMYTICVYMQCRYVIWSYLGQITHFFLKVSQIWKVLKINHFKFQI